MAIDRYAEIYLGHRWQVPEFFNLAKYLLGFYLVLFIGWKTSSSPFQGIDKQTCIACYLYWYM